MSALSPLLHCTIRTINTDLLHKQTCKEWKTVRTDVLCSDPLARRPFGGPHSHHPFPSVLFPALYLFWMLCHSLPVSPSPLSRTSSPSRFPIALP